MRQSLRHDCEATELRAHVQSRGLVYGDLQRKGARSPGPEAEQAIAQSQGAQCLGAVRGRAQSIGGHFLPGGCLCSFSLATKFLYLRLISTNESQFLGHRQSYGGRQQVADGRGDEHEFREFPFARRVLGDSHADSNGLEERGQRREGLADELSGFSWERKGCENRSSR